MDGIHFGDLLGGPTEEANPVVGGRSESLEPLVERVLALGDPLQRDTVERWVGSLQPDRRDSVVSHVLRRARAKDNPSRYLAAAFRDGWIEDMASEAPSVTQEHSDYGADQANCLALAGQGFDPNKPLTMKGEALDAYRDFRKRMPRVVAGDFGSELQYETESGNYFTVVFQVGDSLETKEGVQMPPGVVTYHFPEYPGIWTDAWKAQPKETLVVQEMTL